MGENEKIYEDVIKTADEIYIKKVKSFFIPILVSGLATLIFGKISGEAFADFFGSFMAFKAVLFGFLTIISAVFAYKFIRVVIEESDVYKLRLSREQEKLAQRGIYIEISDEDYNKYDVNPVAFLFKKRHKNG
ncbi:MAG: hypothetical protein RR914_02065 [Oscillospiraceae bacterium]